VSGFDRINGVASDPDEYVGSGGAKGEISSVLHVNTTTAGTAANTDETDLWSYTLPGGTLSQDGRGVRVTVFGSVGANVNAKTMRLYFGGTLLASGVNSQSGTIWRFQADVIRTSASAQVANAILFVGELSAMDNALSAPSETISGAVTIRMSGQNGTAAANDIVFRGAIVEALN